MQKKKFLIITIAVTLIIILPFMCAKAQEPSVGTGLRQDGFKVSKPERDTIRVVMLVCDTTSLSWTDSAIVNGKPVPVGEPRKIYELKFAKWAYGYSVREYKGNRIIEINNGWGGQYEEPYYEHVLYLGEDKKPLFNKIVWMAKEVGSNR